MKKLFISISLLLILVMFSGCETKVKEFAINKKLSLEVDISDPDGSIDKLLDFKSITRTQLSISEDAVIEKAYLKSADIEITALPGHIAKDYNINMEFTHDSGPYSPFFSYDSKSFLDAQHANLLYENYLSSVGTGTIIGYVSNTLMENTATKGQFKITTSPLDGKPSPINMKVKLTLGFTLVYTDCFYTGNFGNSECK